MVKRKIPLLTNIWDKNQDESETSVILGNEGLASGSDDKKAMGNEITNHKSGIFSSPYKDSDSSSDSEHSSIHFHDNPNQIISHHLDNSMGSGDLTPSESSIIGKKERTSIHTQILIVENFLLNNVLYRLDLTLDKIKYFELNEQQEIQKLEEEIILVNKENLGKKTKQLHKLTNNLEKLKNNRISHLVEEYSLADYKKLKERYKNSSNQYDVIAERDTILMYYLYKKFVLTDNIWNRLYNLFEDSQNNYHNFDWHAISPRDGKTIFEQAIDFKMYKLLIKFLSADLMRFSNYTQFDNYGNPLWRVFYYNPEVPLSIISGEQEQNKKSSVSKSLKIIYAHKSENIALNNIAGLNDFREYLVNMVKKEEQNITQDPRLEILLSIVQHLSKEKELYDLLDSDIKKMFESLLSQNNITITNNTSQYYYKFAIQKMLQNQVAQNIKSQTNKNLDHNFDTEGKDCLYNLITEVRDSLNSFNILNELNDIVNDSYNNIYSQLNARMSSLYNNIDMQNLDIQYKQAIMNLKNDVLQLIVIDNYKAPGFIIKDIFEGAQDFSPEDLEGFVRKERDKLILRIELQLISRYSDIMQKLKLEKEPDNCNIPQNYLGNYEEIFNNRQLFLESLILNKDLNSEEVLYIKLYNNIFECYKQYLEICSLKLQIENHKKDLDRDNNFKDLSNITFKIIIENQHLFKNKLQDIDILISCKDQQLGQGQQQAIQANFEKYLYIRFCRMIFDYIKLCQKEKILSYTSADYELSQIKNKFKGLSIREINIRFNANPYNTAISAFLYSDNLENVQYWVTNYPELIVYICFSHKFVDTKNMPYRSPLVYAIARDNQQLITYYMNIIKEHTKEFDVKEKNYVPYQFSFLAIALKKRNYDIVKQLIKEEYYPIYDNNSKKNYRWLPLFIIATNISLNKNKQYSEEVKIAEIIINNLIVNITNNINKSNYLHEVKYSIKYIIEKISTPNNGHYKIISYMVSKLRSINEIGAEFYDFILEKILISNNFEYFKLILKEDIIEQIYLPEILHENIEENHKAKQNKIENLILSKAYAIYFAVAKKFANRGILRDKILDFLEYLTTTYKINANMSDVQGQYNTKSILEVEDKILLDIKDLEEVHNIELKLKKIQTELNQLETSIAQQRQEQSNNITKLETLDGNQEMVQDIHSQLIINNKRLNELTAYQTNLAKEIKDLLQQVDSKQQKNQHIILARKDKISGIKSKLIRHSTVIGREELNNTVRKVIDNFKALIKHKLTPGATKDKEKSYGNNNEKEKDYDDDKELRVVQAVKKLEQGIDSEKTLGQDSQMFAAILAQIKQSEENMTQKMENMGSQITEVGSNILEVKDDISTLTSLVTNMYEYQKKYFEVVLSHQDAIMSDIKILEGRLELEQNQHLQGKKEYLLTSASRVKALIDTRGRAKEQLDRLALEGPEALQEAKYETDNAVILLRRSINDSMYDLYRLEGHELVQQTIKFALIMAAYRSLAPQDDNLNKMENIADGAINFTMNILMPIIEGTFGTCPYTAPLGMFLHFVSSTAIAAKKLYDEHQQEKVREILNITGVIEKFDKLSLVMTKIIYNVSPFLTKKGHIYISSVIATMMWSRINQSIVERIERSGPNESFELIIDNFIKELVIYVLTPGNKASLIHTAKFDPDANLTEVGKIKLKKRESDGLKNRLALMIKSKYISVEGLLQSLAIVSTPVDYKNLDILIPKSKFNEHLLQDSEDNLLINNSPAFGMAELDITNSLRDSNPEKYIAQEVVVSKISSSPDLKTSIQVLEQKYKSDQLIMPETLQEKNSRLKEENEKLRQRIKGLEEKTKKHDRISSQKSHIRNVSSLDKKSVKKGDSNKLRATTSSLAVIPHLSSVEFNKSYVQLNDELEAENNQLKQRIKTIQEQWNVLNNTISCPSLTPNDSQLEPAL